MFTGIIEGTGTVAALDAAADGSGARLAVDAGWLAGRLELGESVAVNGCCVTVAETTAAGFAADLVAETLRRTALGGLAAGAEVNLERYVVEKGSVAVDGVSLTVAGVAPGWFTVALVPHTLEVTTLGRRRPGDPVQLEVDVVAKYVERLVAPFTDKAGAR